MQKNKSESQSRLKPGFYFLKDCTLKQTVEFEKRPLAPKQSLWYKNAIMVHDEGTFFFLRKMHGQNKCKPNPKKKERKTKAED